MNMNELTARRQALLDERASWEHDWKVLARHFLPRKCLLESEGSDDGRGGLRGGVLDSTGIIAMRDLAAGLHGGMTSPARPWFKLGLEDDALAGDKAVRDWLEEVEKRMRTIMHRSNFYNAIHHAYAELGTFGTAFLFALADEKSVVRFVPLTVGEYCLDTDEHGRVDTVFRTVRMTLRQILRRFEAERIPGWMHDMYASQSNWNERFSVIHAVFPRKEPQPGKPGPLNMPFASLYYLEGGTGPLSGKRTGGGSGTSGSGEPVLLSESGFASFPGFGPRWDVTGSDVYGRSPGMDVLPDSVLIQQMTSSMLQALHKEINPPMVAPAELKNINLMPGGANHTDMHAGNGQAVYPAVQVRHNIQGTQAAIQGVQRQIREGLFNDLFKMLLGSDRRQITAREVAAREEEKLILIGPVLERMHDELFMPLISRVFELMNAAGTLPDIPEAMQGQPLRVEFVSVLAQAQKMAATGAVEQFAGFVSQGARAFPEMLDALNPDKVVDAYAEYLGVASGILRGQKERDEMRETRKQQEAQAAQMEQGKAQMDMLAKAGQAGSSLQGLLGGMQGAGGGGLAGLAGPAGPASMGGK